MQRSRSIDLSLRLPCFIVADFRTIKMSVYHQLDCGEPYLRDTAGTGVDAGFSGGQGHFTVCEILILIGP